MKKSLIAIVALLLAVPFTYSQENDSDDLLSKIEELPHRKSKVNQESEFKKADLEVMEEMGFGFHSLKSDAFTSGGLRSGQFYLSLLNGYVRPVSWFSINLGANVAWDYYRSKDKRFYLDDAKNILARDMTGDEKDSKRKVSRITTSSFQFPATLQFYAGKLAFRVGAEAILNVRAFVHSDFVKADTRTIEQEWKARMNRWGYDFIGGVSYDGFGLFVKYMPETVRQFPEPGPSLERWTFGLCLGF